MIKRKELHSKKIFFFVVKNKFLSCANVSKTLLLPCNKVIGIVFCPFVYMMGFCMPQYFVNVFIAYIFHSIFHKMESDCPRCEDKFHLEIVPQFKMCYSVSLFTCILVDKVFFFFFFFY